MILALCTAVIFLRPSFTAQSKANLTIRLEPLTEIGLMEMAESCLIFLGDISLIKVAQAVTFRGPEIKFNAGIQIFRIFTEDH